MKRYRINRDYGINAKDIISPNDYATRKNLATTTMTLDGEKAQLKGFRMRFAQVWSSESDKRVEYSWETVERIVTTHGNFKS